MAKKKDHGPEGFVAMDAARAQAAGIVTEAVQSGGLGAEIMAQGVVAATPEGEAVLTARADGALFGFSSVWEIMCALVRPLL
jgi:cobalt-zinc-cadmium efflux system membrane fusion protein